MSSKALRTETTRKSTLAVLGLAHAAGYPLDQAAAVANMAAGIVVGKVGTATIGPAELKSALAISGQRFPSKHCPMKELPALLSDLRRRNQKVVLANGCFDLIHVGHIQLVSAARDLGDFLIVPNVGELQLNPGTAEAPETGYRSTYNKETEQARPGWYHVKLDEGNITCDLSATERVGFHQYKIGRTGHHHGMQGKRL